MLRSISYPQSLVFNSEYKCLQVGGREVVNQSEWEQTERVQGLVQSLTPGPPLPASWANGPWLVALYKESFIISIHFN